MFFYDAKPQNPKKQFYINSPLAKNQKGQTYFQANQNIKKPIITKKQLEIRYAIEKRYFRSEIKYYRYEPKEKGNREEQFDSRSHSSQESEYQALKNMRFVSLKEFHDKEENMRKKQPSEKKYVYRRLRIHTDQSGIIKKGTSEKSVDHLNFFKKYLNQTFKTNKNNHLSIKEKRENRSQNNHYKVNSHRALIIEGGSKLKKKPQTPKLRQLSEVKSVLY